jgi:hypothetical protein
MPVTKTNMSEREQVGLAAERRRAAGRRRRH